MPKVYLPRMLRSETIARLEETCEVRAWTGEGKCPPDVAKVEIADADAVLGNYPYTAGLIESATRVRIIANIGVGYDNVDVAAATAKGIIVTNTPDVLTETTADLTFALLMATARRLGEAERFVRSGQWTGTRGSETLLGGDVFGTTLGVIGLGRIGAAVARRGLGFGMRVLYFDPIRRPDLEAKYEFEPTDMDSLLRTSDFVTIHMPLSDATRHIIGAREMGLMKPSAYLINASRGPVIDEQALIKCLSENRIAGAGLDVFEREPVDKDNPLLKMDNVVVLPHVGSATVATRFAMETLAANNVLAVLRGERPLTPVNPKVLDR